MEKVAVSLIIVAVLSWTVHHAAKFSTFLPVLCNIPLILTKPAGFLMECTKCPGLTCWLFKIFFLTHWLSLRSSAVGGVKPWERYRNANRSRIYVSSAILDFFPSAEWPAALSRFVWSLLTAVSNPPSLGTARFWEITRQSPREITNG